jgi:DNA adenine methylase
MDSPLQYLGGKSRLSKSIIERIPKHETYCEVFAGAAWVFFRKEPSRYEVINDLDSELVAFYRVLQHHLEEFLKQFRWLLASREWFEDWKRQMEAGGLTDIQKAARYYYVQRQCFAGRVRGRTFGVGPAHRPRVNLLRMEEELSEVHLRLAGVVIEHLSWEEFIPRYDREGTFFYLDPPYWKKPFYRHNFVRADFERLADVLGEVKGKWIMSINDEPEIREIFGRFHLETVTLSYSAPNGPRPEGRELLVGNL